MSDDALQEASDELNYTSAMRELEAILQSLDQDDIDIDALTSQVKRAAELIDFCRGRIHSARVQVEQVVAGLSEPSADEASSHDDP